MTLAIQEDAFEEFENLSGMDSPEDHNLAWTGELELGSYSRAWGSTLNAPFFKVQVAKGWSPPVRISPS